MKTLSKVFFIGMVLTTSTLSAQTIWYVDITNGSDAYSGLSPNNVPADNGPKTTITAVINTGALNDGDIINIAAGIYTDCPTISKNITINGYSHALSSDVVFNVSSASMVFMMSGTTVFTLSDIGTYGPYAAGRFYFTGSTHTGIYFHSGHVLLSTAIFYIEPPFLFQTYLPAATIPPPMTWYADIIIGLDGYNGLAAVPVLPAIGPVTNITRIITMGLGNDDLVNISAGTYSDAPAISKNVNINGYHSSIPTEVIFNLSLTDMVFSMAGRTTFSVGAVSPYGEADRFHFTGSMTTGIHFQTGRVYLSNAIFYFTPPFLFQGEVSSTGVRESESLPEKFDLKQCYPNPFNPSTTISFNLPTKSFVSLKVFDLTGREVATIVSEEMSAGSYSKQWNAANMSSGVYFYRLQTGSISITKKLIFLK